MQPLSSAKRKALEKVLEAYLVRFREGRLRESDRLASSYEMFFYPWEIAEEIEFDYSTSELGDTVSRSRYNLILSGRSELTQSELKAWRRAEAARRCQDREQAFVAWSQIFSLKYGSGCALLCRGPNPRDNVTVIGLFNNHYEAWKNFADFGVTIDSIEEILECISEGD